MQLTINAGTLSEGALIEAIARLMRAALVFLLSLLLSMAAPIPATVPVDRNYQTAEDLAYFLWQGSNQGKFWEIETAKTPTGLKRLQDSSGMTEVLGLSESVLPPTSLSALKKSKLPLAGFKTLRGYTYAAAMAIVADSKAMARPFGHGGVGILPKLCPFGTGPSTDNGCLNSPVGTFIVSNYFTGYTGTSYPSRPAYNVPGVDYYDGVPLVSDPSYSFTLGGITVIGSCGGVLQDPKTATTGGSDDPGCGIMPAHCVYSEPTSGSLTLPTVTCLSTANDIVFRGFNLAATGGHNSTYFVFNNTQTGRKVIAYNNLGADPATYVRNGLGSFQSGGQGNAIFFANSVFGHWVDTYSTIGSGSCSFSGTAMTCTSDSGFALGQAVDSTGLLNAPFIVSVNGGGSYTLNTAQSSLSARSANGFYIMGGGMGFNTTGSTVVEYNASTQVNGRDITTQANPTVAGSALTITDSLNKWNFWEGAIYKNFTFLGQVHFETIEYTQSNGQFPVTYTNFDQSGNVCYVPALVASSSVTSCYFLSTGAVAAPIGAAYIATYVNVTLDKNVITTKPTGSSVYPALASWGADTRPAGGPITNLTITNNYFDRGTASYYSLCSGVPYTAGNVAGQVSFMTASSNATTNKLVVSAFLGGFDIVADGSNYVWETGQQILSQDSGTTGKAGTYSTAGGQTLGSRGMRSNYPMVLTAPVVSGNVDMPSGQPISTANMISRADSTHPCSYPAMAF